jgi:YegS/Rv2252/BmrU family lipid kinase
VSSERRHVLLVNPASAGGRSRRMLPGVERALAGRGIDYRVVITRGVDHAREQALHAAAEGEVPVVMSGDGLIGQVGGALAGGETPIGLIPAGRGNDLARVLGIPADAQGAVDVLAAGRERAIDVGEANGGRFLGIASCGMDSDANRIANEARVLSGRLVYAYAAIRALIQWRPARFSVVAAGERHEMLGYSVAAANSRAYGGGMLVAPNAELDDGLLDVVLTAQVGKLRFLASLPKVFKGEHLQLEGVSVIRAAEVEISADRPFAVYADGERIAELPALVRLLPRALRVIAPAG